MNDRDREQWVDNVEILYLSWQHSRQPKRTFVKAHREEIDRFVEMQLHPPKDPLSSRTDNH